MNQIKKKPTAVNVLHKMTPEEFKMVASTPSALKSKFKANLYYRGEE